MVGLQYVLSIYALGKHRLLDIYKCWIERDTKWLLYLKAPFSLRWLSLTEADNYIHDSVKITRRCPLKGCINAVFSIAIFSSFCAGVIVWAMLITVTQVLTHTNAFAPRKATPEATMWVSLRWNSVFSDLNTLTVQVLLDLKCRRPFHEDICHLCIDFCFFNLSRCAQIA